MLKKIIKICFITCLTFNLFACGSNAKEDNEHPDVNSAYSIKIKFDSNYELNLDEDDKVVFSTTDDKNNKAFNEINVLDQDYETAILDILEYGFQQSNKINELIFKTNGLSNEFKLQHLRFNLFRIANTFKQAKKLNLAIYVDEFSDDELEHDDNYNITKLVEENGKEYYFNSDGSIAKTFKKDDKVEETNIFENEKLVEEIIKDAEGKTTTNTFSIDGKMLKTAIVYKDTSTQELFYEKDILVKDIYKSSDNYVEEKQFGNDGVIIEKDVKYENGNHEHYNYINGNVAQTLITYPDGSYEESSYDENNLQTSYNASYADGSTKQIFFERGIATKSLYEYPNQYRAEFSFNKGVKASALLTYKNGDIVEQEFYPDGETIKIETTTKSDSSIIIKKYNDAAILLNSLEQLNNGDNLEKTYYPNGNIHSEKLTKASGEIEEKAYNEDGSIVK